MSYNRLIQLDGKVVLPSRRNRITHVTPGSEAELAGIQAGDRLIRINAVQVRDILDYRFLTAAEEFSLAIQRDEGEQTREYTITIQKDPYEDLGLTFESGILDKANSCANGCVFCFIDQLPKGMRDSLYFKDDDSRLSFLQGNFVTLTNMTEGDIDRIIAYRISPINISVHTTNPQLREKMLNNRAAGRLYERMERLAANRIQMSAQIVLVPGWNDGPELEKSLRDLVRLHPFVLGVAIVPLGMTKYRAGLTELQPFDRASATQTLRQVEALQKEFRALTGSEFARCADEFYCMAGEDVPPEEFYDGYSQLEDGIGMIRLFRESLDMTLSDLKPGRGSFTFVTGSSAFAEIQRAAQRITTQSPGLAVNAYQVDNDFFGHSITVAGLLTGQDILAALKKVPLHEYLILPRNMFRAGEDLMLDGLRVPDLERELATRVLLVDYSGEDLIARINETLTPD